MASKRRATKKKAAPRLPKRAPSAKVGDIVRVDFFDHSEHTNQPDSSACMFKVYGVVTSVDDVEIRLMTWGYIDPAHKASGHDSNEHGYSIVRSAIFKVHKLGQDP